VVSPITTTYSFVRLLGPSLPTEASNRCGDGITMSDYNMLMPVRTSLLPAKQYKKSVQESEVAQHDDHDIPRPP
jgi:hypothetical protein